LESSSEEKEWRGDEEDGAAAAAAAAAVVVVDGMKREGWCCCSKGGLKLFTLHHPWPASPISPTRGDDLWRSPLSIFPSADMLISPTPSLSNTQAKCKHSISSLSSFCTLVVDQNDLFASKAFYLLRSTNL